MSTLHLLQYNNYYNRIVKQEPDLSGYQGYQVKYNGSPTDPNGNTAIIEGVNFVDGDYVDTVQVVNWAGDLPDYLLVVEDNLIKSRWYVVDAQKTRGGQLQLALHRDLVADYYANLMSDQTAIFVEKATIPSANDLIFNSEDMTFNQIKTSETLLKDDTQCPWIILYGARNNGEGQETTFNSTFKTEYPYVELTTEQFNNLSTRVNQDIARLTGVEIILKDPPPTTGPVPVPQVILSTEQGFVYNTTIYYASRGARLISNPMSVIGPIGNEVLSQVQAIIPAYVPSINSDLYDMIISDQGKYIKHGSTYYRIVVTEGPLLMNALPSSYAGSLETALAPLRDAFVQPSQVTIGDDQYGPGNNIHVSCLTSVIQFRLEEVPAPTTQGAGDTVNIGANRYHLVDAPYDMFCLPLSDSLFIKNSRRSGFVQVKSSVFLNLSVANQLIADYAAVGQIYDAQILPYCPITNHLMDTDESGNLVYDINDTNRNAYSTIEASGGNDVIGYVLHASRSSFAINIDLEEPIVISDYKLESECDLYRLNSPNYAAAFDFNAAKNGGISTFNVKCTYKPFNPYIKIYPNFGRLYGNDFNDARGLICSGDFSLPTLTDQWKTFELSNKNYQASFDRQIQNIEVNNDKQRTREIWGAVAGTVSGSISGAVTGLSGGPIGAIIGGVLGGVASGVAGGVDVAMNDKLRQEALDYTKDQFGYQLGNIKALPQTLSKTSAYNIDNKYFPFLEYYTCSEVEKQALKDKIKYNGMTVMAIGTMQYYKQNYTGSDPMYFKGKLIRLQGFEGDYHILNAIANEIYKGVFI